MGDQSRCMKCGGRTEEGFMLDHGHMEMRKVSSWAPGKPEASFWSGVKVADKAIRKVRALRCTSCGLLELYA